MTRKQPSVVELVEKRTRQEKRVLRAVRGKQARKGWWMDVAAAVDRLYEIDHKLDVAERAARRAVVALARPRKRA